MPVILILLFILLLPVGFDLGACFYEWQARIGIGRWSDRQLWRRALERRARAWLRRAPTVSISDNRRWILYDMLRGRYRSRTIQSWQDAGLLLGLDREDASRYARRMTDTSTGEWKRAPAHADAALLAYALKKNGALPAQAEHTMLGLLLSLKGERATIPYRMRLPAIRFVDTIGMTAPFLSLCGRADLAEAQIAEYDRALLCGSPFPAHAYDLTHDVPLGIFDWARGVGWYILGLAESNADGRYDARIVELAGELLQYQKKNGGFGAMFFDSGSVCESSGSALIGLLMLRAYRAAGDRRFIEAAFGVEKRLMSSTRRSGALDYCQGDTKGVGYYSRVFSVMPFAQGIALMLSKELDEYANG